ncbi:MAG TPA: DUF885 domain-containing protein [Microscillaceae bacterium]|nr:DUF885 domain-containing protein [Microscillaceae bacterium]
MTKKPRSRGRRIRRFVGRTFLVLLLAGVIFLVNLIWFKPFFLNHYYDKVFVKFALGSPETISTLGLPIPQWLYHYNDDFDDISDKALQQQRANMRQYLKTLKSYSRSRQSESQLLSTDIMAWFLDNQVRGEKFAYHDYPVNQMGGIQSGLPSFMESSHRITSISDAKDYNTRLSKFPLKFDQLLEGLKIRENKKVIPPRFVIDRVLKEMKGFVATPAKENILYVSIQKKLNKLADIDESEKTTLLQLAEKQIQKAVYPAYQTLIDYFTQLRKKATTEDGVWKLPNGKAYYTHMLRNHTTTDITPEEVFDLGKKEVTRITAEMKRILDSLGHRDSTKTPQDFLQQFNKEKRFLFSNDDKGRQQAIAQYQKLIDHINQNLDKVFDVRPKAGVTVKRIPKFKEKTAPGAYYETPALDGSRPGVFFANLRDMNEITKYGMPTLAYHEAVPGHHFQLAVQMELKGLPFFRKVIPFTAYAEGWALYAERLAKEYGFYKNDPYGDLGRLQAEIFRAVRLVVDAGLHYKKWTREQAIEYMVKNTGMNQSEVVSEIERYIVTPGQACAYKVGQLKILALRTKAKKALGNKFDIREFHNVILKNGAVPLTILEKLVDRYIQRKS